MTQSELLVTVTLLLLVSVAIAALCGAAVARFLCAASRDAAQGRAPRREPPAATLPR